MITSPMATGNGAFVIHKILESKIPGYKVTPYSPYRTLFPPSLYFHRRSPKTHLIHTTPDHALFFKEHRLPLVLTFHNYVLDPFMRRYSSFLQRIHYLTDLRAFTKRAVGKANALTAVSHFTAQLAQQDLRLKHPLKVIYNGVDHNVFKPTKKPHPIRSTKGITVLFCGNLTERKGAQWLIPIAEKLDSRISIAYTAGLRTGNALPAHPQLTCLGTVPYDAMPAVYHSADMLLFPTVREGFGLAAAEAMACGLPVIGTNCSSLPELIDDNQGGFLCPPGDVNTFAEKIEFLAENPLIRKEMGEYNRVQVEKKFTIDLMVSQYIELFDGIRERT